MKIGCCKSRLKCLNANCIFKLYIYTIYKDMFFYTINTEHEIQAPVTVKDN